MDLGPKSTPKISLYREDSLRSFRRNQYIFSTNTGLSNNLAHPKLDLLSINNRTEGVPTFGNITIGMGLAL